MKSNGTFKLHPSAKIFDPSVPGVKTILEALQKQLSLRASYCRHRPIQTFGQGAQWLDCQTSGSTGQPKVIRRSPLSWQESFDLDQDIFGASSRDHFAILGSLGHSLSLFAVLEALHLGATLSVLSTRMPRAQVRALYERNVSVIYATPTQLKQVVSAARSDGLTALPALKRILIGGGKLLAADRALLSWLAPNANVIEFYGTSETSFITIADSRAPSGSVGRLYPDVDVKIVGANAQTGCGEVHVRSPYLATMYIGSQNNLIQPTGFVATGEVGYFDVDGFLFLCGRTDRMMTVSDVNVFPEAIEQTVSSIEGVEACGAVPVADPIRGNRIICFVKPAVQGLDPSSIRRQCRYLLGEAHVPKEVRFVAELPILPSGKLDLVSLAAIQR